MQIEELIKKGDNGAYIQEIQSFEKSLNIILPDDIKNLYLKYNGIIFNKKYILQFREYKYDDFYSTYIEKITDLKMVEDIINEHISGENYDFRTEAYFIERKILPIIITSEDYYEIGISIDDSSKDYGSFFLLPYEAEEDFCKIADNLQDFLNKFKKVDD